MIKSIMGGNGVVVNNGYASVPYFQMNYTYSGREVNGDMRLNSSSGNVEVFANGCWNMVSSHASVDLDAYTHTVIEWAKSKMEAEKKYAELAKKIQEKTIITAGGSRPRYYYRGCR